MLIELIRFLAYVLLVLVGTVVVGLGVAWLFGGACKLGGPDDPRNSVDQIPPGHHAEGELMAAIRRAHDSRRAKEAAE